MRRPCQHHSRIDAASQACGAASRWLLTAALIVITALTASVAAARSGDTSAALATNQVIRQFSLRNSVGMATQLLQGRVVEASGKLRGAPMGAAGAFFPNNLGSVPSGFGLPQRDGNGRPMGYCAWDNSTDSDSSSYLGGASRPQQLLYAVISPGLNGSFETNCDTVELTGQAAGDDYVEVRLASEAASQQYRSAISTVSVLNSTPGQEGDIRLVLENNRMYSFVGGAWQPITSLGPFNDNSSANGAGALTYTGGTVTVAAFEAATAALSSTLSVTGASTFNGAVTATNGLTVSGGGLNVTGNTNLTGNLNVTGTFNAGTFQGNGSGLTDLNAGNINAGILGTAFGGTGVNASAASNGALLIGNGSGFSLGTLAGTVNQVIVTNTAGGIQLSLPQNISTTSTPTFGGLMLNGPLNGTTGAFTGDVAVGGVLTGTSGTFSGNLSARRLLLADSTGGVTNPNLVIGNGALGGLPGGTGGNTVIGVGALGANSTGSNNVAFGRSAGYANASGVFANANTTGSNNTFLGVFAMPGTTTQLTYATALGSEALVTTSNTIALGRTTDAVVIGATGTATSGILQNKALQVTGNVGISGDLVIGGAFTATSFSGNGSGLTNLNAANISTGVLPVARGGTGVGTTPTNGQLLIGNGTGYALGSVSGTANQVTVNYTGGNLVLSLPQNIATASTPTFGGMALNGGLTGTTANFSGRVDAASFYAGGNQLLPLTATNIRNALTPSTNSIALGTSSFAELDEGTKNTSVGYAALQGVRDGTDNAVVDYRAGYTIRDGSGNTALGSLALDTIRDGTYNTALGYSADASSDGLSYATVIGANASVSSSNTIVLGRTSDTTVIGATGTAGSGTLQGKKLQVTGDIGATGNIQIDGIFTGNGSGLTNLNAGNFTTGVLPVARGGTGVGTTPTNGQILIGNGTGYSLGSVTGTANQVTATYSGGNIALSLPQNIGTASTPTFGGMALNGGLTGTTGSFTGTLTAQRLILSDSTGSVINPNLVIGLNAMQGAASGNGGNTAIGSDALRSNTSGESNVALGYRAMEFNTTGSDNTVLGAEALQNNISGYRNTALGRAALKLSTTGYFNTAIGELALWRNLTGYRNVAIGNSTLGNSTGNNNSAIGSDSLASTTSGSSNSALGTYAGSTNIVGNNNTFVGASSNSSVNNLSWATAIGSDSLVSTSNTIVLGRTSDTTVIGATGTAGSGTLLNKKLQVTGDIGATGNIQIDGTFTGNGSGLTNLNAGNFTTGVLPVARGGTGVSTASNGQLLIGTGSGFTLGTLTAGTGISISNASGSITITNTAGAVNKTNIDSALTFGTGNLTLGTSSMSTSSVGSRNTAIGQNALTGGPALNGADNTALGFGALQTLTNSAANNTAVGSYALNSSINGLRNTAVGTSALRTSQNATDNTAVGYNSQYSGIGASRITTLGTESLYNNTNQNDIIAIGYQTAYGQGTPNANGFVAIGNYAMYNVRNSQGSVALGHQALRNLTDGSANVAIGINAGYATSSNNTTNANTSGANNTFIGSYAMPGTSSQLTYATALGSEAVVSTSSTVVLGRTSDNTVIGATGAAGSGTLLNKKLQVTGDIGATGNIQIDGTFTGNGSGLTNLNASNITTGVLSVARGGTGVTTAPTNGQILIGNGTGYALGSITGTANRITVTNGAGTINLNLPQDIATTSTPTFGGMVLNGGLTGTTASFSGSVTAQRLIVSDGTGGVAIPNVVVGSNAMQGAASGYGGNIALGVSTLTSNTTGDYNVAINDRALTNNTTGSMNVGIGSEALKANTTGSFNMAIGDRALFRSTTGNYNVAMGLRALQYVTTGSSNTAIGSDAGSTLTTGSNNTLIGERSNVTVDNLSFATALGADSRVSTSNTVVLGRTSDNVVIGATGDNGSGNKLQVNGNAQVTGNLSANSLSSITTLRDLRLYSTYDNVVWDHLQIKVDASTTRFNAGGAEGGMVFSVGNSNLDVGAQTYNTVLTLYPDRAANFAGNVNLAGTSRLAFGTELGDKIYLWDSVVKYGFGINNANLTAFVPDDGRFSLRRGNYNGTEVFTVDANGLVQLTTGQELRFGAFGEVSDPVFFRRINNADNRTVLQLAVGDDERTLGDVWGDEFQIGRTVDNFHNGFIPVFRVAGNGDAILSGSFTAFGLRPTAGPGTIIGWNARPSNSGALVTAIGQEAMGGANNNEAVAVGRSTLYNDTGIYNVGLGNNTLAAKTSGNANTGLGHFVMVNLSNGNDNVAIGHRAGDTLTTGGANTLVGTYTNTGSNNINYSAALGYGANVSTSNTIVLGRTSENTVVGRSNDDGSGNRLQVNGSVKATAFNTSSDRRLKTDIRMLGDDLLDRLGGVNAYNYRFIADPYGKMRYGVIAQEVAVLFPDAVSYDAQGLMAVDYGALGAIAAAGVGKLNVRMNAMDELVKTHGTRITTLENRVQGLDDRVGSLETWRTATNTRMDTMQKAIDLNIEKIAEHALKIATNTEKITNLEKVTGEINTRLLTAEGVLDSLNKKVNTSLAKSEDGNTLTVLTPNLVASNFSAEQVRARSAYAERLEAEIARIRELEVDNLRANTATARNVRAETVNTGSAQVYAGVGNPAFLFSAPADGHYTVNTSALDGSYATATVIVNGGVAKVVPIASEGIDLIAVGNTVKAAAAGKSIKASWIKMG